MRRFLTCLNTNGLLITAALPLAFSCALSGFVSVGCSSSLKRAPSSVAEGESPIPPLANGKAAWLYSWTQSPDAAKSPASYLEKHFATAEACVEQLSTSKVPDDIEGCEGNGLATGPGVYTSDNPFTSHDYGSTLLVLKVLGDSHPIGLLTGRYSPPPADGTLTRQVTGNKKFDGILYNFRANDLNTRALVIRSSQLVDIPASYAVTINSEKSNYKKFSEHAPFACSESTPIKSVLANWGDHIEFLALTFDYSRDPENLQFRDEKKFNRAGVAAFIASEATLFPSSVLEAKIKLMMTRSNEMNESMKSSSCAETEAVSTRACVAQRIFNSLIEENGTPNRPTYIWKFSLLQRSLIELGAVDAKSIAGVHSSAALLTKLVSLINNSPTRLQRATEAYSCMLAVRSQMKPTNFQTWGADPE